MKGSIMANKTSATFTSSDGKSESKAEYKPGDLGMYSSTAGFAGYSYWSITKDGKSIGSADTREEAFSKAAKAVS